MLRNIYNNAPLLRHINPNNRYNQVPVTESDPSRTRTIDGHVVHIGETSDGVFSNMSAKPSTSPVIRPDQLPSYFEASQDPSPPYWETSVMSEFDEIYIDGIPVGNIFNFFWSVMVSVLFQFLGFVITYLLHTSHAAKNGSQVGLGLTIINLGISSLPINIDRSEINSKNDMKLPLDPNEIDVSAGNDNFVGTVDDFHSSLSGHGDFKNVNNGLFNGTPLLAYTLFILGGFIILKAVYDYIKVKRLEFSIMYPISNTSNASNTETEENV